MSYYIFTIQVLVTLVGSQSEYIYLLYDNSVIYL